MAPAVPAAPVAVAVAPPRQAVPAAAGVAASRPASEVVTAAIPAEEPPHQG